jgi:DNA-directed RNA polymerase specialized sigma24 family protein
MGKVFADHAMSLDGFSAGPNVGMDNRTTQVRDVYLELLRAARRYCRSAGEAHDVVQDAFEVALSCGLRDWAAPARRAWLRGVVRKRAAFVARGQARRRRREQLPEEPMPRAGGSTWQPGFLAALPRGLRRVAALASADLNAAEIRWLLGLPRPPPDSVAVPPWCWTRDARPRWARYFVVQRSSQNGCARQLLREGGTMSRPNLKISKIVRGSGP